MSRKQLKLGVPYRYSNAVTTYSYTSNEPLAQCRVRGRMSVALSRERINPQAPRPPQREMTMSSFCYRASGGSGDESQDQGQNTLGLSNQSGPSEPTPELSNPFPPSPSSIQDPAELRVDKSSTKYASSTPIPVRMPTPDLDQNLDMPIRSEAGDNRPSLASWLVHFSDRPQGKKSRNKKPLENGGSLYLQANTRTEAAFSQQHWGPWAAASGKRSGDTREDRGRGKLSAWLEPGGEPAGDEKRVKPAGGKGKVEGVVQRSSGRLDEEEGDSGKWMSERLGGLDPSGEARAKDSWTYREKRYLTSTDIALASTRKAKRPRGWRTHAGGGRVFVAPSRGGARGGAAVLASGQAAFRASMRGRSKTGVAQR